MHFILLNQFYAPDIAPTGQYLHSLAQVLVERGHQVKVYCSCRSYDGGANYPRREVRDGVEVIRLPALGFGRRGFLSKLADYVSFYLLLWLALLRDRSRPDLILALTTPPYIGLLGKLAAKWHRCRHGHWVMDLYPDVMRAHGLAQGRGLRYRLLQQLTRIQWRGADCVIALGPVMERRVAAYCQHD